MSMILQRELGFRGYVTVDTIVSKGRGLGDSIDHFGEKLVNLEGMMKTEEGRRLAKERTERVRLMMEWWKDETEEVREDF